MSYLEKKVISLFKEGFDFIYQGKTKYISIQIGVMIIENINNL